MHRIIFFSLLFFFIPSILKSESSENFTKRILTEIKETNSRFTLLEFFNWKQIYNENKPKYSSLNLSVPQSPEELKRITLEGLKSGKYSKPFENESELMLDSLSGSEVKNNKQPDESYESTLKKERELIKQIDFKILNISEKNRRAEATILQSSGQITEKIILILEYQDGNWYLNPASASRLGYFER